MQVNEQLSFTVKLWDVYEDWYNRGPTQEVGYDITDQVNWCDAKCKGDWSYQNGRFWFDNLTDFLAFKLTWK